MITRNYHNDRGGQGFVSFKVTILTNGLIVTDKEVLINHCLVLENDTIVEITPMRDCLYFDVESEVIDCKGNYILPGLIDVHSDMIETIIVPRKGVTFPVNIALHEADRQLINHGITTIYHSISIANSTICNKKRTLSVDKMIGIGDAINEMADQLMLHHRFHARLEMNTLEAFGSLLLRIRRGIIHELSLMNHTPGQGQYSSLETFKKEIVKQYGEVTEQRMDEIIHQCQSKPLLPEAQLRELIDCAREHEVPIAYHDVETEDHLQFMKKHSIEIGEFPLSLDIAKKAKALGFYNLVGAPNILRGGSHNSNISATELVTQEAASVICSDYYSPSLLLSIFILMDHTKFSLPDLVAMVTTNPAKALKIDDKYGTLAVGKKADIIVVDRTSVLPKVTLVMIEGQKKLQIY